jgi:hypothetical protein
LNCAFTDEESDAVIPKSIACTLSDETGEKIATGTVPAGDLAASEDIVLSGTQLAVPEGEIENVVYRRFTVEAAYDSDAGLDPPLKDSCRFPLRNQVAVT